MIETSASGAFDWALLAVLVGIHLVTFAVGWAAQAWYGTYRLKVQDRQDRLRQKPVDGYDVPRGFEP